MMADGSDEVFHKKRNDSLSTESWNELPVLQPSILKKKYMNKLLGKLCNVLPGFMWRFQLHVDRLRLDVRQYGCVHFEFISNCTLQSV